MENAIPSVIIGALLIVASTLMAQSGLHSYDKISTDFREMQTRLSGQSQTRLTITGVTVDGGGNSLSVNLANQGSTRITSFDRVDLIVTYFVGNVATTKWLPYSASGGPATWSLASITNDVFEPGILDPGENAVLTVQLGDQIQTNKTNFIYVGNELGSGVSTQFSS